MEKIILDEQGNVVNDAQIIEYTNLERVNFDDPMSILRYGTDLLNEMGNLMKDVSTMMRRDEVNLNELTSKIEKIASFNNELDQLDKEKQNQLAPVNPFVKKVTSFFSAIFNKEEEAPTYADQFDKYTENLDLIGSYVEEQKNNTIADINMYKEFINKIEPYVDKIRQLIQNGEVDLTAYKAKIETLEKDCVSGANVDGMQEVTLGKQKIELFSRKLDELRKNLVLTENTITECKLKQGPDMELVFMYDSYVNTTLPTMKVQAASLVGVRRQANALASHKQLIDATNETLKKNSQMLVGNIQEATKLSTDGNIRVETLTELHNNIQKGIQILNDGNAKRIQTRAKNEKVLNELSASLEKAGEQSLGLWAQDMIDVPGSFETHNYPSVSQVDGAKQKRFKMLPNIGKKGN